MRGLSQRFLLMLILGHGYLARADWPSDDDAKELGLQLQAVAGTEIRIWLGGGIAQPFALYRIINVEGVVTVEHIAWSTVTQEQPGVYTQKAARRETNRSKEFLERYHCDGSAVQTAHLLWCRVPVRTDGRWSVVFADLLPQQLWELPKSLDRGACGSLMEDGETVSIEILEGTRRHAVSYANPDFCCPLAACAVANHVRQVVRERIR
jgi:hypothetical protein